jgi:hypothetical protein
MSKRKPYIKRRLQTFRFAGRAPRGLYWKKDVYREWYEWAKLSGVYPADWGNLEQFDDFEDWWKHPQYGFELFCEPVEKPALAVLKPGAPVTDDSLVLAIDKGADPEKALVMVRNLLKKHLKSRINHESQARYKPTKEGKYIKLDVLRRYRFAYTLMLEGKTRREMAPELMKFRKSKQLPTFRVITRDLTAAKQILKSVAVGVFPGALPVEDASL